MLADEIYERRSPTLDGSITSMPILILHVHENCNCKCSMCDIWKRPPGREVSIERIASYQDSIRRLGVRQVVLTGGEPLLHTQFSNLCALLKQCDVKLTLLSTGLLLQKRSAAIAESIDEIIVSLDGPEAIHNEIRRVPRAYQLLHDGISAIKQLCPGLQIRARCTVQNANFRFLRSTVTAARQLGCDSISFLAVDTTSLGAFNRGLLWPTNPHPSIGLSLDDLCLLEEELELLLIEQTGEFESGFIVERPEKLRGIVRYFQQRLGKLPARSPVCNAPWVSAVIEVDGSIRPCFFHAKTGNTTMLPIHEAINTASAIAFRQTLDIANNPICQNCVCSLNYRS